MPANGVVMSIENALVLVTGAHRGLGRVFVQAPIARGARKVSTVAVPWST